MNCRFPVALFFAIAALVGQKTSAEVIRCAKSLSWRAPFSTVPKPERVTLTGKVVQLWQGKDEVSNYNDLVNHLVPGDQIDFAIGVSFTFARLLGQGRTTFVVKSAEGLTLRLPKQTPWLGDTLSLTTQYLEAFVRGQVELKNAGVPVVGLDLERIRPPRYLVVEELPILFNLSQFLGIDGQAPVTGLDENSRAQIENQFIKFAKGTWRFSYITNLAGRRIGWTGDKWVLFDIDHSTHFISKINSQKTVFDGFDFEHEDEGINYGVIRQEILPPELLRKVRTAILAKRAKMKDKQSWLQRKGSYKKSEDTMMFPGAFGQDDLPGLVLGLTDSKAMTWQNFSDPRDMRGRFSEKLLIGTLIRKSKKDTLIFRAENLKTSQPVYLELQIATDGRATSNQWSLGKFGQKPILSGGDYRVYDATALPHSIF